MCARFVENKKSRAGSRAEPVAQLIEHRVVTREVLSSTPAGPTLRVLKITEEKVLPL